MPARRRLASREAREGFAPRLTRCRGRRQLIAYFHIWYTGQPAPAQCEGCTFFNRVFETYWTTGRGTEALAPSYGLLDMTVYGRQEVWEDSPPGWPRPFKTTGEQFRSNGRPTAQWSRLAAGRSDDLGTGAQGR